MKDLQGLWRQFSVDMEAKESRMAIETVFGTGLFDFTCTKDR